MPFQTYIRKNKPNRNGSKPRTITITDNRQKMLKKKGQEQLNYFKKIILEQIQNCEKGHSPKKYGRLKNIAAYKHLCKKYTPIF